jgi:uncharacterized membrane protein
MRHLYWILVLAAVWAVVNFLFLEFIVPPAHAALHEGHFGVFMAANWLAGIISFPHLDLLRALNLSPGPASLALASLIWGTTVYLLAQLIRLIWRRRPVKSASTA